MGCDRKRPSCKRQDVVGGEPVAPDRAYLDPAQKRRLDLQLAEEKKANTNGKPKRLPPKPEPQVIPPVSRWVTFWAWVATYIIGPVPFATRERPYRPRRIHRLLAWAVHIIAKTPEYLWVVWGPKVSPEVYEERMAICRKCPVVIQKVVKHRGFYKMRIFCKPCNCGTSKRADLKSKLWYSRHYCPRKLHPGTYPADEWASLLIEEIEDESANSVTGDVSDSGSGPPEAETESVAEAPTNVVTVDAGGSSNV